VVTVSEDAFAGSIWFHNADRESPLRLLGECDVVAARRPDRGRIGTIVEADALRRATVGAHDIDLLTPAAIGLEADTRAVGRERRRRIDGSRICEARGGLRAQIHQEDIRVAALLQAHDHALSVRRKARREGHARKVPDDLALPALDVEQIDARLSLPIGHVGDFLAGRREARRQHQVVAAGEVAYAGAILVHDGEPLDPALLRARLVDEDNAAVEVALLAGEALIDRIRDEMPDAPPVVG